MKKYYLFNSVMLGLGIAFSLIGGLNEGIRELHFKSATAVNVDKPESSYDNFRTYHSGQPFKKVRINLFYTDVTIKKGSKYQVELRTNRPVTNFSIQNQTLKIAQKKVDYNFADHERPQLTITVPQKDSLEEIKLDQGNDEVDVVLRDLNLEKLFLPSAYRSSTKLSQIGVTKQVKSAGGNFEFRNCQLNNWSDSTKHGRVGEYKIIDSTLQNTDISGTNFELLQISNSRILGNNQFKLPEYPKIRIKNSQLNNLEIIVESTLDLDVLNTEWHGRNRINAKHSKLEFSGLNSDLGISVLGENGRINYRGQHFRDNFAHNYNNRNQLLIKGKDNKTQFSN